MSCPTCGSDEPETNEGVLKRILLNMRYVNAPTIERFLNNYRLGGEVLDRHPDILLALMKHMFGPGQGESAFRLFEGIRGTRLT
jgi:hypothetical protein